ncbi:Nucleoprotein TPR, partial [Pseudolycoriella hygida]
LQSERIAMDAQKYEVIGDALQNDEIDKIPEDIAKKLEKYYESRNEDFMNTKVLYDTVQQNYETLRSENEELTSKNSLIEAENQTLKVTVTDLQKKVDASDVEISRLSSQMVQREAELSANRKERTDLVDERDQLQKLLDRKEDNIERLNENNRHLEEQLQAAVGAKYEALARLDEIEGKEQMLKHKEKLMEMENELKNSEIANLRDNLNRNLTELAALRKEITSTTIQFEIDLKQKTEELRNATLTIQELTETNQTVNALCDEISTKLKDQMTSSGQLMEHYRKELDAMTKLAEFRKDESDEHQTQVNELNAALKELQRIVNQTTDECGIFETKLKQCDDEHQKVVHEKDQQITQMKQELKVANEMLEKADAEHAERIVENYMPSANAMNRRLKTGLTFTEICAKYFELLEQVKIKDQEIQNLKLHFETVFQDVQEKATERERLDVEFKKATLLNEELQSKIEDLISERVLVREEMGKLRHLEKENTDLKTTRADLRRQVCHLLNEIEYSRGGTSSDHDQSITSDMPANEVISSRLVVFNNIVELQEQNEKLLLVVRDLSTKLEEMEEIQNSIDNETFQSKCKEYERRLLIAEQSRRDNEEQLENCLKEKERYKQMACDLMKDSSNKRRKLGDSMEDMDTSETGVFNGSLSVSKEIKEKKIANIEQMLEDKSQQLKELRDEFNEYRTESKNTIKSLNEQNLDMRNELRELTTANCKLTTQTNFMNEQVKTQQVNVTLYKTKIQTLENRSNMLENTIAKHETSERFMKDEAMNMAKKVSTLEARCDQLQRENNRLSIVNRNLEAESSINRERITNIDLKNHMEMQKVFFERLETEGRIKTEKRLDDAIRECSALRRRLQEEQDYYRVQIAAKKSETDVSEKNMSEQLMELEALRSQLKTLKEQLQTKNEHIKVLQESSTVVVNNTETCDHSKMNELETKLINASIEIEKLSGEIKVAAEREAKLRKVATDYENEALKQTETFDVWRVKMTADLEAAKQREAELVAKVDDLQTEIRLQAMDTDSSPVDAVAENKAQTDLKEALQKLSERERELRDLWSECNQLKIDLRCIGEKYSNEMRNHSMDVQALTTCKSELDKCQKQTDQIIEDRDRAIKMLKENQAEWEKVNSKLIDDKAELEQKMEYLEQQNTAMHDQLQAQCNKAAASIDSMNESINSSFLNRSLTHDEAKEISSEKLLKVIKFLRKEKDCSITKVEILKNENIRLLNDIESLKKRLSEQSLQLNVVPAANISNDLSANKYDELMRKVETLNAVMDNNVHLREEKEALVSKAKDLTDRILKVEDELFPLQEKNRELLAKYEEQEQTIQMLRKNVDQWRKRSSDLVERNNKNPEDFKRLQNERENLAQMLTTEKEKLRHTIDELVAMKNDKIKVEQELAANFKQLTSVMDERKKAQDDLSASKQTNARLTQEIIEIKSQILKKEDEIKSIQNDLTSKDSQLTDIKNKEVQIRRIAKKYKDSYFDLKQTTETRQADLAAKPLEEQVAAASNAAGNASPITARVEAEKVQAKKIEDLSNQLLSKQDEIEQLRNEIETLKKQDDKHALTEARNRVLALTETNRQVSRDYQACKSQLQTCEQSRSEHDAAIAALKSQLEAKIKELVDQEATRHETIARLTRENENLNTRVNQLHRQLQQQGSKPSTSSGNMEKSPSDPARTAN